MRFIKPEIILRFEVVSLTLNFVSAIKLQLLKMSRMSEVKNIKFGRWFTSHLSEKMRAILRDLRLSMEVGLWVKRI